MSPQSKRTLPLWVKIGALLSVAGMIACAGLVGVAGLVWLMVQNAQTSTYFHDVYRIAPGDYEVTTTVIEEGGAKVSKKSILIPMARIASANATSPVSQLTWHGTEGIKVERIEAGKDPETRLLKDAAGMMGWVKIEPVGDGQAQVEVVNFMDGLSDSGRQARYILHVPKGGPALIGGSASDVEQARSRIAGRSGAVQAMQRMDDYGARLRKVFGEESGLNGEFADQMRSVESAWLTGSGDPAAQVEKQIAAFVKSVTDSDPRETLYLLSVVHGDALTPEQIAESKKLFGVPIADGYAAAPAAPPAGLPMLLVCLVADDLPDDFEGIVRMLRWVTEDVSGPIIIREWDVGDTHYIEYLYYRRKGEDLRRYVAEQFRIQRKDLPAATRLLNVIKYAARSKGPFSLLGEHVYHLDYTLDMRQVPAGSNRTADGYQRNYRWFWKRMLKQHSELFDDANKMRIQDEEAPVANDHWLKFFPMHGEYKDEKLHHHHIGRGPIATPVPARAHAKYRTLHEK